MTHLKGTTQLRARMMAIKRSFKPIGKKWAETTVSEMRPSAPRRTGKGAASIRVKNASMTRATVSSIYYMSILDKGHKAYPVVPRKGNVLRFQVGGNTVFARKVNIPARSGMGFAGRAANSSLRQNPMAQTLIDEWNKAA